MADELKGDAARSYFYLVTAYWNKWACCDTDGTLNSSIKPWMEQVRVCVGMAMKDLLL